MTYGPHASRYGSPISALLSCLTQSDVRDERDYSAKMFCQLIGSCRDECNQERAAMGLLEPRFDESTLIEKLHCRL